MDEIACLAVHAPLPSSLPARHRGRATGSVSRAVKSVSSTSPARTKAARLRTWVTICTSATARRACATDQPTNGTLTISGLAASAMIRTRGARISGSLCALRSRRHYGNACRTVARADHAPARGVDSGRGGLWRRWGEVRSRTSRHTGDAADMNVRYRVDPAPVTDLFREMAGSLAKRLTHCHLPGIDDCGNDVGAATGALHGRSGSGRYPADGSCRGGRGAGRAVRGPGAGGEGRPRSPRASGWKRRGATRSCRSDRSRSAAPGTHAAISAVVNPSTA